MALIDAVKVIKAVQYDGTNSADVLTAIGPMAGFNSEMYYPYVESEENGVLTVRCDDQGSGLESPLVQPVSEGQWVMGSVFGIDSWRVVDASVLVPLSDLTS